MSKSIEEAESAEANLSQGKLTHQSRIKRAKSLAKARLAHARLSTKEAGRKVSTRLVATRDAAKHMIAKRMEDKARQKRVGLAAALTASGLTSIVAVVLKASMAFLDAYSIIWLRFMFAGGCLGLYLCLRDPKSAALIRRPPIKAIIAAVCLGFNYFGFMQGLAITAPSNAQVLGQFGPLMLVVLSAWVMKEKITRKQIAGFGLAILGFYLFFKDQLGAFSGQPGHYMTGNAWILAGGLGWAVYALLEKQLTKKHDPQALNLITYVFAALCFLPFVDFNGISGLTTTQWLVIFSFGVNTLLTYGALGIAFKYLEANKTSIIITLNPIVTILIMQVLTYMSVSWIGEENIQLMGYIGAALVVSGAIVVVS